MTDAMERLRADFAAVYLTMRSGEKKVSGLRPGQDEHRRVMLEIFEAKDILFEIATQMLSLRGSRGA